MSDLTRQGSRKPPRRWLHPNSSLLKGSIVYQVKFWGYCQVSEPSGADVVRTAIEKLKLQHQLQKQQGFRSLKVLFAISYRGVRVSDAKSKSIIHQHSLKKISYAGDDKSDKSLFAYIAADGKDLKKVFNCYIFDTDKFAMQVSLTVAQSFHLACKAFEEQAGGKVKPDMHKKLPSMQRQSIDEPEPMKPALAKVPQVPAAVPEEALKASQKPAEQPVQTSVPVSAPAEQPVQTSVDVSAPAEQPDQTSVDVSTPAAVPETEVDKIGYFEPFNFESENELPAPVFGPGIEDIDGAIKQIEEQLATLDEGFEKGFTITD